jgi:hypothetical protein
LVCAAPGTVLQYALVLGRLDECLRRQHNADNLFFCERAPGAARGGTRAGRAARRQLSERQ